jgi:hypothetical protein
MRIIILTIIISLPSVVLAQMNGFDSLKYDKVMAYEFQGEGGRIITYCLKKDSSRITKSIELSNKQIKNFETLLTSNSSYGNTTAACFDPHLAIVYYQNYQIVGSIDICLGCNSLSSSIDIPATRNVMIKVSDDYSYPAAGFSKGARKSIDAFCRELGFTKFLDPLYSIYDQ